ncbi:MAG: IclR family transcriptional regulator [Chloroflexi bacterium]|nr:IclR family transcriptional regulator [Chloroflexota bacterium]
MALRTTPPIQSIQRAAAIMRCFTEKEPELGVTDIGQRLGLHKSTVSRMLTTLQLERLVERNPDTGRYRLGLGVISLAGVALGRLNARAAAQPYLDSLLEKTQETINVTVLDEQECVVIERAFSPQPIRYMGWIGRRAPLHCSASGKVLLAYMTMEERTAVLPPPLSRHTNKTITDLAELVQSLPFVRQQGFAIAHEEYEEGTSSIAAPIYNYLGQVVATLAISGPTYRLEDEAIMAFVEPLLHTTQQISADLGYSGFE